MRKCTSHGFRRGGVLGGRIFIAGRSGELAQDSIHERSGGPFTGAFNQFDTFVQGGALWNSIEPEELIKSETQGDENFSVKFGNWLRGRGGDLGIEARTPAEDAHDEFGRKGMIGAGESLVGMRMQEIRCIRRFALDAEKNVEGGGASGRDGHRSRL